MYDGEAVNTDTPAEVGSGEASFDADSLPNTSPELANGTVENTSLNVGGITTDKIGTQPNVQKLEIPPNSNITLNIYPYGSNSGDNNGPDKNESFQTKGESKMALPTEEKTNTEQEIQPVNSGIGTLPDNDNVEEVEEEIELPTKKNKSSFFTTEQQSKVNEIVKKETSDVEAKIRAEYDEKEAERIRLAEEDKLRQTNQLETLITQKDDTIKELREQLKNAREAQALAVAEVQAKLDETLEDLQSFNTMLEAQIDKKIANWSDDDKLFDPKNNAKGYTLEERLDWVNKAERLVQKAQSKTKTSLGNVPDPEPVGSTEADETKRQEAIAKAHASRFGDFNL
jgi:hypothetical protein